MFVDLIKFIKAKWTLRTPPKKKILIYDAEGDHLSSLFFQRSIYHLLKIRFEEKYNLNHEDLLINVYKNNRANSFLSSFFPFLIQYEYFKPFLEAGIDDFLKTHVLCIKDFHDYDINFIGSVAYYLKDIILKKSKEFNFSIGNFIKEPITELVKYHSE